MFARRAFTLAGDGTFYVGLISMSRSDRGSLTDKEGTP